MWWLIGVAAVGGLAYRHRTRGFDRIAPELRSPLWRLRSPSIGPGLLKLARKVKASAVADGVTMEKHIIPAADGSDLIVYSYRPANIGPDSPAMLFTHGGGMIMASAEAYHATVSAYARDLGIVTLSTEYRLAPEYPFPIPLDDVHTAYRWLLTQAGPLGIDPKRIAVGGDSAGGGLTAALCQRVLDAGDPPPVFQLLIYPMIDDRSSIIPAPEDRGQLLWTQGSNLFGWTSYLGRKPTLDSAPDYAAPARRADLSGLPPAWIGVGALDLFYDEDLDYARRLEAAGVPCAFVAVEGAFHGFDGALAAKEISKAFRAKILAAVRQALGLEAPIEA